MKTLTMVQYQFNKTKKSLIIYYGIIVVVMTLITTLNHYYGVEDSSETNSIEMSSAIFIFVTGLNAFKPDFNFAMANGVSRKKLFSASLINLFSIAAIMTLIDLAMGLIVSKISNYSSLYNGIYSTKYGTINYTIANVFEGMLWSVVFYAAVAIIGYFITTFYYRINKALKLLVSIGVPIVFMIGIPMIDALLGTQIGYHLFIFIPKALGIFEGASNPYIGMFSSLCTIILGGTLTYLLMRRATIKE